MKQTHLPKVNMSIPTSLSEFTSPTNLFTIKSEIFCYPKDWVRHTTKLSCSKLSCKTTCKNTKSTATLSPRISPIKLFIVVNSFFSQVTIRIQRFTCNDIMILIVTVNINNTTQLHKHCVLLIATPQLSVLLKQ